MFDAILLTGPAGAGISSARYVLETLGYPIVENVPISLAGQLFKSYEKEGVLSGKLAIISDIAAAEKVVKAAKTRDDVKLKIIVLSCTKESIINRYSVTGHTHPRSALFNISLEEAIDEDLASVSSLIEISDIYIDTTYTNSQELRTFLTKKLTNSESDEMTNVTFMSYGSKKGAPQGLDMSIDVRIIPNPYYVDSLKDKNAGDQEVIDYMLSFDVTQKFLDKLVEYLEFYIKQMQKKGRANYNIGIACSGGHHRSPYVANYLAKYFSKKYRTTAIHRDCPELNEK